MQDLSYQHAAYLVSYLFLVAAMPLLVVSTTKRITLIAALDVISGQDRGSTVQLRFRTRRPPADPRPTDV